MALPAIYIGNNTLELNEPWPYHMPFPMGSAVTNKGNVFFMVKRSSVNQKQFHIITPGIALANGQPASIHVDLDPTKVK